MTTKTQNPPTLNGVDVAVMRETVSGIKKNPELAQFKFRAHNQWQEGGFNKIRIDNFYGTCQEINRDQPFNLNADEPHVLLGKDRGVNPAEYLLTALSSCMTTSLAYHAAAEGIEIESLESRFEGDIDLHGFLNLDPSVRKGYREIRVNFKARTDADKKKLEELMQHSPIFDVVTNPTPVKVTIETE